MSTSRGYKSPSAQVISTLAGRKRSRDEGSHGPEGASSIQDAERACDACKRRRVKCDKSTPCANCQRRGEDCRTTVDDTPISRPRSTITKEHEKRFDSMEGRLATIEDLLRKQQAILTSLPNARAANSTYSEPKTEDSNLPFTALPSPDSIPAHDDNDATTETHSIAARKLVEKAVEGNPAIYQDSEMIIALHALKDMAERIDDGPNSLDYSLATWRPIYLGSGYIVPPSPAEVSHMLDKADGSITLGFTPGLTAAVLRDRWKCVLRGGTDAGPIRRIYVYGTLRNLAVELGGDRQEASFSRRCKDLSAHFSMQLGSAVNDLKFMIPATEEAASALTMASGAAMELCRPLIASSLSSKAASMVLSLGYNNLSTMRADNERVRQVKILVFWMAYWLDTSFAVRLGRAPVIRPHDIAVPQLPEDSIIPGGWTVAFNYSTSISGLQCKVVEQLYTPLASRQPLEERQKRASVLVTELNRAWEARGPGPTAVPLWEDSDKVMHHSTVCLVQHATMSSADTESPALASARKALTLNVEAWYRHKHLPDYIWAGHCHWTLLKGPITPFVVTFCHIIAHPFTAQEDLRLLGDFVQTIYNLRRFSDGMIRLHKLCDIFTKVAMLYVQAKGKEASVGVEMYDGTGNIGGAVEPAADWSGQPAVDDIDGYLSSIGFAPPSRITEAAENVNDLPELDPNFLMDWYQGNNSLMGFLEQDMTFAGDNGFDFGSG